MADTQQPIEQPLPPPAIQVAAVKWRGGEASSKLRDIPVETPVALVYDASTEAVMMATPDDLEDFAIGFSLTEGLIASIGEIARLDIVPGAEGIEARIWLTDDRSRSLQARRRYRAGPTGCGLCGIESLEEAGRSRGVVTARLNLAADEVKAAIGSLDDVQGLGARTRAVHAAGFWSPKHGLMAVREDVGRHNALDKLAGAMARGGIDATEGAIVLTSRVSLEMVQKAVAIGAPILIAMSAPTALAVRTAEAASLSVFAIARADGFEVFTQPGGSPPEAFSGEANALTASVLAALDGGKAREI